MTTHQLEKGTRFNLDKEAPGLTKVRLGLGWEENTFDTGEKFDLDASIFALGANGKIVDADHFVYYNNTATPNKSIVHRGDNRDGRKTGDDETIEIDLALLDPRITEISIIVTIDKAAERKQNFGQVNDSQISLYDAASGNKIAQYELDEDFSGETAVQFGSLYKKDGQWLFKAVGAGFKKGLGDFLAVYKN